MNADEQAEPRINAKDANQGKLNIRLFGCNGRDAVFRKDEKGMRQLEIDSDKFTTLSVCGFLILDLWIAISSVMGVASGTFQSHTHSWFNYLFIIVASCGFLSELRGGKLRQEYPYGFLAFGLFIVEFAFEMVLPRDTTGMASRVPGILGLAVSALAIFEIARWFRARVRIANPE